jgi:hypothetical protein
MSKLKIKAGTASKLVRIVVDDASSTTGAGLTGLAYNSPGLACHTTREGDAVVTDVSLAQSIVGTWTSGGFVEVDPIRMPGLYEFGITNAALAAGAQSVVAYLLGAPHMVPVRLEIELDAIDYQNGNSAGLASLVAVKAQTDLLTFNGASVVSRLSSSGLDSVVIEAGVNARQALSPILAAAAGVLAGAGTTSITIAAANNANIHRIAANVDGTGNRSAVSLNLPA